MKQIYGCMALSTALFASPVIADSLTMVWESPAELNGPESALYDSGRDVIYVSNVNGAPNEVDGNGYIARLSPDGAILETQWVEGLNAPKGLAMHGGKLYVSDIDQLVEIDLESGDVTNRYAGAGAQFLNDVTADQAGNVYVSDMVGNKIYRLSGGEFAVWLDDARLDNPNGLHVDGDKLIVGAWGKMTDGFNTAVPGHLKTVSIDNASVKSLGSGTPVGNLDGVEPDGRGNFYVTDWMAGKLFLISPSGEAEVLLELGQGSADHEVIEDKGLIVIPLMNENKVVAYRTQ